MMKMSMTFNLVVLACLVSTGSTHWRSHQKKPNIVYILADDLGWNDLRIHNPKVITPNLDELAKKGIELTNSYAQPICSPSRSALMTGKYPSNNGLQHIVLFAESQTCLPLEHQTLPEYMKKEGYVTKYVGKWHLGYCNEDCLPENRGIDEFSGMLGGECDYYNWTHNEVMLKNKHNKPTIEDLGTHLVLKDIKEMKELIDSHDTSKPLFMVVSPTAPHVPLTPTDEMFNVHDFLDPDKNHTRKRREYLGLVSGLDDLVGETMKALEEAGIADNTIVIFQSDNGGAAIEPFFDSSFESHGNNYPLRNSKYSFHDGGVRVPTIYYDPRLHPRTRGTKRNFLMHITDWLPTFVQLANRRRRIRDIDGISQISNLGNFYLPAWKYRKRHEMLVGLTTFAEESECSNRDAAFRWRDWKLIYGGMLEFNPPNSTVDEWPKPAESPDLPTITGDSCYREENGETVARCLFNMRIDPNETTNLYDTHPHIVRYILRKIEKAKEEMVRNVHTQSLNATDETTREFEDVKVPRHDYCTPSEHFPLEPNPSSCDPDEQPMETYAGFSQFFGSKKYDTLRLISSLRNFS